MERMQEMVRVEVIGNQILLQDLVDSIEEKLPNQYYTVWSTLRAKGRKGKANGDDIWMEKNFVCLMFVHGAEAVGEIQRICAAIKTQNTTNALTMFTSRVVSAKNDE